MNFSYKILILSYILFILALSIQIDVIATLTKYQPDYVETSITMLNFATIAYVISIVLFMYTNWLLFMYKSYKVLLANMLIFACIFFV
jgi:hypothetical protein